MFAGGSSVATAAAGCDVVVTAADGVRWPGRGGIDVDVGPGGGCGFPPSSVGRGVGDISLAFMTTVAVGEVACVGRNVGRARGDGVADGCGLGDGKAVAALPSALAVTVTVTVLVAVAVSSVGVADGSTVGVTVVVEPGTTTVCWKVVVGPFAGAGVVKRNNTFGQGIRTRAAPMITTITRAIAAWTQDGRQREKPE